MVVALRVAAADLLAGDDGRRTGGEALGSVVLRSRGGRWIDGLVRWGKRGGAQWGWIDGWIGKAGEDLDRGEVVGWWIFGSGAIPRKRVAAADWAGGGFDGWDGI